MQHILSNEEFTEFQRKLNEHGVFKTDLEYERQIMKDLRTKIMELAKFRCYHDFTEEESKKIYVDEGYCDDCPLSFCTNEKKVMRFHMCNRKEKLFSK